MRRKPESPVGLPDEEVPQEVWAVSGERAASTIIPVVPDVVIDRGNAWLWMPTFCGIELGRQAGATFAGWISQPGGLSQEWSCWPLRLPPGVVMGANDS